MTEKLPRDLLALVGAIRLRPESALGEGAAGVRARSGSGAVAVRDPVVRAATAPRWAVAARDLALRTLTAPPGGDRYIRAGMCTLAAHRVIEGDQPAIIVLDASRADTVFTPRPGPVTPPAASARPGTRRHPVTRATARTGMPLRARRFQPPALHQDQLKLSGIGRGQLAPAAVSDGRRQPPAPAGAATGCGHGKAGGGSPS
ncbi:hypothetical protein Apa02nite_074830 [Actinoplanes palleronii]|uniref:Uncharacterized protein n=1 Tax=Actinoplanes palleronii TaxID=113570 RepID=A0ABQ4BL18_9ACTN|nr:hypothetical protein Apa02nite_074830 [Actinoplanes palleronii]